MSDRKYDPELLARRMCGKRGQPDDLASALGLKANSLGRALRRMKARGHPVSVVAHPLNGVVYSYEMPERVCAQEGCGTVLSRFNPLDYCALHKPQEELPLQWFLMPNRRST